MGFSAIPTECHQALASYLTVPELVSLSQTCRDLQNIYRSLSWRTTYLLFKEDEEGTGLNPLEKSCYKLAARTIGIEHVLNPAIYPSWFDAGSVTRIVISMNWFETGTRFGDQAKDMEAKEEIYARVFPLLNRNMFPRLSQVATLRPSKEGSRDAPVFDSDFDQFPLKLLRPISDSLSLYRFDLTLLANPLDFQPSELFRFTKVFEMYPEFRVTMLSISGSRWEKSWGMNSLSLKLPHLHTLEFSSDFGGMNENAIEYFTNELRTLPSLKTLKVEVFYVYNSYNNFKNQFNPGQLLISPHIKHMNNIPDSITTFEMTLRGLFSVQSILSGAASMISLSTILIGDAPLILYKVTNIKYFVNHERTVFFEHYLPYLSFPNLYSVSGNYPFGINEKLEGQLGVYINKFNTPVSWKPIVMFQLEHIKEMDISYYKGTNSHRYVLPFLQSVALYTGLSKLAFTFDFKNYKSFYCNYYKIGTLISQGTDGGLVEANEKDYDSKTLEFLNNQVIPILNNPFMSEFRRVSKQFSKLLCSYQQLACNEPGGSIDFGHLDSDLPLGISFYSHFYIETEWRLYVFNFLVFQFRKLRKLQELSISISGQFIPPLEQLGQILNLANQEAVMPMLKAVGINLDINTGSTLPHLTEVITRHLKHSMEYFEKDMPPVRKLVRRLSPCWKILYEFDFGEAKRRQLLAK